MCIVDSTIIILTAYKSTGQDCFYLVSRAAGWNAKLLIIFQSTDESVPISTDQ